MSTKTQQRAVPKARVQVVKVFNMDVFLGTVLFRRPQFEAPIANRWRRRSGPGRPLFLLLDSCRIQLRFRSLMFQKRIIGYEEFFRSFVEYVVNFVLTRDDAQF